MTIDGAGKIHFLATFVVAVAAVYLVVTGQFETRLLGFAILIADIIQFGLFYEKL
ncbi:MAG: hypothetical protein V1836_04545 [Candidatus Aenigmatarchaeota archaeon]